MCTADATLTVQKVASLTIPMELSVRFAPGLMTLPLVMQSRVELDPVVPLVQPTSGTSTVPTELHVQPETDLVNGVNHDWMAMCILAFFTCRAIYRAVLQKRYF